MKVVAKNKRAFFDYDIEKKYIAGIALSGWEIKSIRAANVNLQTAFILPRKNELFVKNMQIKQYMNVKGDELQDRKLLLNSSEIMQITKKHEVERMQIVPIALLIAENGLAKLEIGVGKAKRKFEKRESIKERDVNRVIAKRLKNS